MSESDLQLSVVIPVYNEVECIAFLHAGLKAALSDYRHEIIVVDDGSTDASRTEIARYPAFRCVSIPHAGKSAALEAGIRAARAQIIVTIDADLQENPADIHLLLAELDRGAAIACGCRTPRVDGLWRKRIPSAIYRRVLLFLFGMRFRDINCGFRAARREVWDAIGWFPGAHRLVPLLVARRGLEVAQISVPHRHRAHGQAKFDSPWRFFEGLRDLLRVRFGRIPREREAQLQERVVG